MTLRLGSANLLSGRSGLDYTFDADLLTQTARGLDVDVLALQEVDRHQPRSGRCDQPALVAAELGAVDGRFTATLDGTPGSPWTASDLVLPVPTAVAADGGPAGEQPFDTGRPQFGVALLSRRPVAQWHVLRLAPARGRFPMPIPSRPPRLIWLDDEPRVAVAAVLENPQVTIACTHLSFVPTSSVRQLAQVRDWLAGLPTPRVLLGDLNLLAGPARWISRATPLVTGPTFRSPRPRVQLDHALATGLPRGTRCTGRTAPMPISDHLALLVDLDLP